MKQILTACFGILFFLNTNAQRTTPINSSELVAECMKGGGELPHKQMALWFPTGFWTTIGSQMKVSSDYIDRLTDEINHYNIFFVVDYTISGTDIDFLSEETLRKNITFKDSSGKVFKPLKESELSPLMGEFIDMFSPTFAQMFGQFGKGMRIFVFKSELKNGLSAFDITKKNSFSINWNNSSFKWKLPFAAALEPKHCPVDGEEMKGNWNFCPEHGSPLSK